MFDPTVRSLAMLVLDKARRRRWRIATAESCTGGLIAAALTDIAGSSDVFERGFVTYSNAAKTELLGVPGDLIADVGAVSEAVARMMAEGALEASRANIALSVTGIAGPGGATPMKPVGLVHFGVKTENGPILHRAERYGDLGRSEVRAAAVRTGLELLLEALPG